MGRDAAAEAHPHRPQLLRSPSPPAPPGGCRPHARPAGHTSPGGNAPPGSGGDHGVLERLDIAPGPDPQVAHAHDGVGDYLPWAVVSGLPPAPARDDSGAAGSNIGGGDEEVVRLRPAFSERVDGLVLRAGYIGRGTSLKAWGENREGGE